MLRFFKDTYPTSATPKASFMMFDNKIEEIVNNGWTETKLLRKMELAI